MASAPLRFGLVGTGYWARIAHAPALAAAEDIELTAVWGRDPSAAAALAAAHHCHSATRTSARSWTRWTALRSPCRRTCRHPSR